MSRYPPLPIIIYNEQIQHFPLVEVTLPNALLYVAQPFIESNPELIILFIKQNLTSPTISEWNAVLAAITPVYNGSDVQPFYNRLIFRRAGTPSNNTALMAIPVPGSVVRWSSYAAQSWDVV